MSTAEYMRLADAVAAEIARGSLKAGDRLPPQRTFAYERGIAVSTASRVYSELLRRGLVVGEVGRGTFITGIPGDLETKAAVAEAADAVVRLDFNYPILPDQPDLVARSLRGMPSADFDAALRHAPGNGTPILRELTAKTLERGGWAPQPQEIVFTGSGRQCIAAALGAVVPRGGRCGVEAMTYPFIKGIAAKLGVTLVPLSMDDAGVSPDAIEKAHHEARLSAVYLQSALQNPLGMTLPPTRRNELATLAERLNLVLIDDGVYGFLCDEPPMAAAAPNHTLLIDSFSKRVAPGLTLGLIRTPAHLRETLAASIRSGGWTATGFAYAAAQRLIMDGTVDDLVQRKRDDARRRQAIAAECLQGLNVQADPRAYHLWVALPEHWRSQSFAAAAARRGIALTPSNAFASHAGHAPNAIRLALAEPPIERLRDALLTLARLAAAREVDFDFTE